MKQFDVRGMHCAACSARVEKAVKGVPGVESCAVSLLTNSMGVDAGMLGVVSRRDVRREGKQVSEVHVNKNESLESALKRFKRQCARAGVLAEVRKREHYEKPSVKRKKKAEAARKRKY